MLILLKRMLLPLIIIINIIISFENLSTIFNKRY